MIDDSPWVSINVKVTPRGIDFERVFYVSSINVTHKCNYKIDAKEPCFLSGEKEKDILNSKLAKFLIQRYFCSKIY